MEINVREDVKLVEIWLTNAEKQDAALRESLKPLYAEYRETQYLVAVFESGTQDVWDAASGLLCYNRKHMAELETAQGKQALGI